MKKICSMLLVLMLFVSTGGTVLAEDDFSTPKPPTTRWWPGNPNPQPGTEDWLFQNYGYNYGSNGSTKITENCLLSALIGGGVGGAYTLVETMKKGGKLTLNRVVSAFGVSTATSYVACLIENGIKK